MPRIHTDRLDLIPTTVEILRSDQNDKAKLARLLNAHIPAHWPPMLLDAETLSAFITILEEERDPFFICWYWVRDEPGHSMRELIGSGGIASSPCSPDTVIIGYSILDEYQSKGYTTEAVRGLIPVIFQMPGLQQIIATTYSHLTGSIRVLEKNGFVYAGTVQSGEGIEEGSELYILRR
ncbi:GNAT family N-acetyltransferase [Methanocalculus taiwanensis]|uniref:GNAT family N-acetyltransferase n=1 Tax=Methanocalculus taiwanensis TaxID=106207 RepID=UPI0021010631|nr:GNAT family N-acetyltransferase [Methanocalculus taiwanensis]